MRSVWRRKTEQMGKICPDLRQLDDGFSRFASEPKTAKAVTPTS